jgi:hypothetical protein
MATTPTIDLSRKRLRIIKPNRETEEIIERVIPARDFRPRPPRRPVLDETALSMMARSRAVLYMFAHREAEIAFWDFHDHILTRDERRAFLHDGDRSVLRPLPPAWEVGDRMYIASNMEAEVIEITESPRGYGTVFKVHDYRVMYLKRGVLGSGVPKTDKDGYAPVLSPEQKRQAAQESAYTGSASQSIADAGAVMDDDALQRIHIDQSASNALAQSKGRVQVTKGRLMRRIAEARAKHRTSTERHLQRQLDRLTARERPAEKCFSALEMQSPK